ncbi:MAG: hypothetical protein FWF49_06465 [Oscillospiraceae bacterium]|nr:hypothetical protein [Oscillospiraceae bacterium]
MILRHKRLTTAFALFLTLALIAIPLASCARTPPVSEAVTTAAPSAAGTTRPYPVSTLPSSSAAATETVSPSTAPVSYTVSSVTKSEGTNSFTYPQLSGLADTAVQSAVNALMYNDAWNAAIGYYIDYYEEPIADIEYTVTFQLALCTDRLLSILYTGYTYDTTAPHPNGVWYGQTIDLQTGALLKLSDFVPVDQSLVDTVKNSTNFSCKVDISNDELMQTLRDNHWNDQAWLDDLNSDQFYLTPVALIIIFRIDHAVGDQAWFTLPGYFAALYSAR